MKKEEFIEECWFIYGVRIRNYFFGFTVYHSAGNSGQVEFDWEKAMHPMLLGWIHTHPRYFGIRASSTDESTMRGWVRAKARRMICGILCHGEEGWYEFYRDSDSEIKFRTGSVHYLPDFVWGKF
jgi:hypothetical protein